MNRREFARIAALMPFLGSTVLSSTVDRPNKIAGKPLVLLPDTARVYDVGRGEGRILVGGEQSGGTWWLGSFRSDPERLTSLHVHHSMDEQFYALEGVISLWMDGSWRDLPPGALAIVPQGTPHALGNWSQQAVRFLNSGNPSGFEQFFADIDATVRHLPYGSPQFFTALKKIYPKYNSEMLGPPPQRS